MSNTAIRQRLHQYIETAEEKKIKAIFTLFEEEIRQQEWEYSDQFKKDLDKRFTQYKKGTSLISSRQANKEIKTLLTSKKLK